MLPRSYLGHIWETIEFFCCRGGSDRHSPSGLVGLAFAAEGGPGFGGIGLGGHVTYGSAGEQAASRLAVSHGS